MNILLRLKDWKLFLLIFGLPLLFQAAFIWVILTSFPSEPISSSLLYSYIIYGILILILFSSIFISWLWGITVGLQKYIPETFRFSTTTFKIVSIVPLIYLITMGLVAGGMLSPSNHNIILSNVGLFIVLILFHLFAVYCIFYAIYIAAKTFRTVELQREVTFTDFAGDFFLIWFYPIGIWTIQPKLNFILRDR